MNFYNEFDPKAAAWLRVLIQQQQIPDGIVDERSILEIQPNELSQYTQCHFFAGIGGWSLALQLAGWPSDRPVWTGSCPCQPFSSAGKQLGDKDERHLWPAFFNLIRECRPDVVFGEQVASAIGKGWLDGISSDLESENYACGATILGAHSVGAPHIRQRLYWVAERLEHAESLGREPRGTSSDGCTIGGCGIGGLGNSCDEGSQGQRRSEQKPVSQGWQGTELYGSEAGFWSDFEIMPFRDGKARRVEPGSFPVAHGVSGRVGLLRGYGNAIVPQTAQAFIEAFVETITE